MKKRIYLFILLFVLISLFFMNSAIFAQDDAAEEADDDYELFFLRLYLPKTKLYLGEKVPLTIAFYNSDLQVDEVECPEISQPEFAFGESGEPAQSTAEVDGHTYQVVRFTMDMIPLKTGSLTLGPVTLRCKVVETPLGADGSPRFYRIARRTLEVKSQKIKIFVSPLPSGGRPSYFSGGIGSFQVALKPETFPVRQGEPMTLRLTVTGSGNLESVAAPYLMDTNGVKVFPAQRIETRRGRAVFKQVLIPLNEKLNKIGPFVLAYFDPDQRQYHETSVSLPVNVRPNPEFQTRQETEKSNQKIKSAGILAGIKKDPGDFSFENTPLLNQRYFWLWHLVPLCMVLASIYYKRYQEMMQSDCPQSRAIKAGNKATKRLSDAKILLERKKYEDLLDRLHFILRDFLGERFNLATAGMTGSVVRTLERIEPDLEPGILERIHIFFAEYDSHRFTGSRIRFDKAMELWETVNSIVNSIKRMPPPAIPARRQRVDDFRMERG